MLFHLSAEAGLADACRVLQNQINITTTVLPRFVPDLDRLWKDEKDIAKKFSDKNPSDAINFAGQIQLWRTGDTVYLGTAVKDCADIRVVYKLSTKYLLGTRHMVRGK